MFEYFIHFLRDFSLLKDIIKCILSRPVAEWFKPRVDRRIFIFVVLSYVHVFVKTLHHKD